MVAIEGWEKTSDFTAVEFAKKMVNIGVQTIVYTDIATDGTLAGPNVNAMAEMASAVNADIIARAVSAVLTTSSHLLQQWLRVLSLVRHFIRIRLT